MKKNMRSYKKTKKGGYRYKNKTYKIRKTSRAK